tara:strand:- start:10286 stop:11131 length:846 start_codon:yes stop_codon:yes gene_type:complete
MEFPAHYRPVQPVVFQTPPEASDELGATGELAWVSLECLLIDGRYQRPVLRRGLNTIRKIVEDFNWSKFDPLVVSRVDDAPGHYAVVDGQHRAIAAMMVPGIVAVPAIVHQLDLRAQARAFCAVNAVITKMSALQLHQAGLAAGDPDALYIDRVTRACGVTVLAYPKAADSIRPGETMAVGTIRGLLRSYGEAPVKTALTVLRRAYPDEPGIASGPIQAIGLASVAVPAVTVAGWIDVFVRMDMDEVFERARLAARISRGGVALHASRVLIDLADGLAVAA